LNSKNSDNNLDEDKLIIFPKVTNNHASTPMKKSRCIIGRNASKNLNEKLFKEDSIEKPS